MLPAGGWGKLDYRIKSVAGATGESLPRIATKTPAADGDGVIVIANREIPPCSFAAMAGLVMKEWWAIGRA